MRGATAGLSIRWIGNFSHLAKTQGTTMPSFQGSGLLSLAGSLYGVHTATAALRQSAASSAAGIAEDRAIIDRTINEEDRRLAKAKRRVVRAQRRALNRAFGGVRTANPGSAANPAAHGFLAHKRGQG
jgi:hypothetical protein